MVEKLKSKLLDDIENLSQELLTEEEINNLSTDILYGLKIISFICRMYAILGVNQKNRNRILYYG